MADVFEIVRVLKDFRDLVASTGEENAKFLRSLFDSEERQLLVADFISQFLESEELPSDLQTALSLFGAQCFLAGVFKGMPPRGTLLN